MVFLRTTRDHLAILGILPMSKESLPEILKNYQNIIYGIHSILMLISLTTYTLSMGLILFQVKTFVEYAAAGFYCIVSCLHLISFVILVWIRPKLLILMKDSEDVIQRRSTKPEIEAIYAKENERMTDLSRLLWKISFVFTQFSIFPILIQSLIAYYTSNHSSESFELLFLAMFPWNWKTPHGYLAAVLIQALWIHCGIFITICTLPLFAGFCGLFQAFTLDIKKSLQELNNKYQDNEQINGRKYRVEIIETLIGVMKFHAIAKGFTVRFSNTYRLYLTFSFALLSTLICCALLGLYMAFHTGIEDILRFLIGILNCLIYLSLMCIYGDDVTTQFDEIHNSIYKCDWFKYPLKVQKLIPVMLIVAEKPVYIQGYMNIRCTRELIKKIINAGLSYFMVFRTFEN